MSVRQWCFQLFCHYLFHSNNNFVVFIKFVIICIVLCNVHVDVTIIVCLPYRVLVCGWCLPVPAVTLEEQHAPPLSLDLLLPVLDYTVTAPSICSTC